MKSSRICTSHSLIKWIFFFILYSSIASSLIACESPTTDTKNKAHDELMVEAKQISSEKDMKTASNKEQMEGNNAGVHEIDHLKRGVYGGSDVLRRPPNTRSGATTLPARPLSILSTTRGHVAVGLLVLSFFFI